MGSSSEVGTFGLPGTPMTAARLSSRFVVATGSSALSAAPASVVPLPFLLGTSTVDMIGGFVSTAFVSTVVFGLTWMISPGRGASCRSINDSGATMIWVPSAATAIPRPG
uniref:(northern house mosquito) hypothetical protein n=1 Tax=Culex pipiens TaxID=7175 RepID=A0A8D8KNH7_CULPI